ncbi:Non-structural maintenance of chromosome element 4 [Psilocybe cubensis]|uniref:Non-structural maintenance of chromosome element 4 n=2 Tax=Psilocybe cubensis TaxID=181762 RepID=A0ACB8HAY8_PSICU|nr:Non-structural maintenance of chromosome element 4 [Psilocybe cubensis]KAH9485011.1 Non-structural maintenance of chromosome element 4 [Psilocybe cubensis]
MPNNQRDHSEDSPDDIVFDPDQSADVKRALRQDYRSLVKKVQEQQGNLNDVTPEDLLAKVQQADELFVKVRGPQEATLDAQLLLMATNLGAQKARAMKSGSGVFDADNFVSKLVTYMGGKSFEAMSEDSDSDDGHGRPPLDWDRIGRKAMAKSHRVPLTGFMLGPLSIEQKKRAVTKRSKLEKNKSDEQKPQELKEEDISRSKNETSTNVNLLGSILDHFDFENPVNIFEFVINPNDFAQSVENVFYLSFLIRDGQAAFETRDGVPVVYGCGKPEQADYDQGLKKRQLVLEFDMETWKRAIEIFDIKKPMIPQRAPSLTKLGDKWYG